MPKGTVIKSPGIRKDQTCKLRFGVHLWTNLLIPCFINTDQFTSVFEIECDLDCLCHLNETFV